jgi:hypothetical protein
MIGFNDYDGSAVMSDEDVVNKNNLLAEKVESVFELSEKQIESLRRDNIQTVE